MRVRPRTGLATSLVALAALAAGPRGWAQSVVVGPQANGVSAIPGGLVTVPVVANMTGSGGASLGSVNARLTWSPAVLSFRGTSIGTAGSPVVNPADTATGTLRFALANAAGVTGTPVLINVTFAAVGAAGASTSLGVTLDELTQAGTFADLRPIATTTSAQFCVSSGRYGDLDNNDAVNSFDALLIVTSAVGLSIAPRTTLNGDVTSDGKVDTRDALVVLSFAVGLPTSPFRVNLLNTGACTVATATSVAVAPASVSVGVGERYPLALTARDAGNAIVNTGPVTWVSRDPLVATVDGFGNVVGVAPGTTRAVAMITPTIMDSATVTVDAARRVWYVNPAVAAGNPVELGSQAFPFSSIRQAVTAAAPNDTVRIAVALYGEQIVLKKSLVVIGDSDATGFPRLRNSTGPAVVVDTAGTVRLSRLTIEDSQGGVIATAADTLDLRAITILRSRAVGINVRKSGYVIIGESSVDGATFRGLDAESTATVRVRQSSVDLIAPGVGGAPGLGLRAFNVDTVVADTTSFTTAGAEVDSSDVVTLRNVMVDGATGPALEITGGTAVTVAGGSFGGAVPLVAGALLVPGNKPDYAVSIDLPGAATLRFDSARVHDNALFGMLVTGPARATMRGDTVERSVGSLGVPVVKSSGVGDVRIAQSRFAENAYGEVLIENTPGGAATASVDSSTFVDTNVKTFGLASFAMRGGQVLYGYNAAVDVASTAVVSLVNVEVAASQVGGCCFGTTIAAVQVTNADSARADSLWVHDGQAGALRFGNVTAVSAYGNLLERNWGTFTYYSSLATVALSAVARARLAQTVVDDRIGFAQRGVEVIYASLGATAVVDSVTFLGPFYAVYAQGYGSTSGDTLVVRGSRMQPGDGVSQIYISVYAASLGHLSAVGNTADTTTYGVYDVYTGSADLRDNVIRNALYGVYLYSAPQGDSVSGNTIECQRTNYSQGVTLYYAPSVVTANTVRSCATGINVSNVSGSLYAAEVRGNVVVGDSTYGSIGIQLSGRWTRPVLARNDVSLGRFSTAALRLNGGTIDSARVDSNTVRDGLGTGILTTLDIVGVSVRGNVVERIGNLVGGSGEGGIVISHFGGGATVVDNRVRQMSNTPGVRLNQAGVAPTTTITFVSDPTWGAQNVCLNISAPSNCPVGATLYGYPGGGWTANLSSIPGATWIWAAGITGATSPAFPAEFSFSKTFSLPGSPIAGTISVAADDFAEVIVNGTSVGTIGSVTDGSLAATTFLTTFNIGPFLVAGTNVITVRAANGNFGCGAGAYSCNPAGVVFGGSLSFGGADLITLDSNVVVDGTGNGVQINNVAVTVTGRRNFVARNQYGFYGTTGTVAIDLSTIQGNTLAGATSTVPWSFQNNYWGDANGPRVRPPADTVVTAGDSAIGVTFSPWLTAPAVGVPVGAPPAVHASAARGAAFAAAPRPAVGATRAVRAARATPARSVPPAVTEMRRRLAEEEAARLRTMRPEVRP